MAITSIQKHLNEDLQFRAIFHHVLEYEARYNPDNVISNATVTDSLTIEGAVLGDLVLVSVTVDLQGLVLMGQVTAADTVVLTLANTSAGAINLAESNLHIVLLRPSHVIG